MMNFRKDLRDSLLLLKGNRFYWSFCYVRSEALTAVSRLVSQVCLSLCRCKELGLLDRCTSLTPRFATNKELLEIHTAEHVENLESISQNLDSLEDNSALYDSVYFHPSTSNVARLAAGCTLELVNAILDGKIGNGMAIVRPPGHHAMQGEFCGYSFFNNAAIAAKLALNSGSINRILIVDFDVHHGQGTQQAFYNDPR